MINNNDSAAACPLGNKNIRETRGGYFHAYANVCLLAAGGSHPCIPAVLLYDAERFSLESG